MNAEKNTPQEEMLRKRGLALTSQRRAILRALQARRDHPTAEQIYDSVRDRLPGLSRATVYRVLDVLVRAGTLCRLFHPGAVVRFDPVTKRHHHLVCRNCGRLFDLDASLIPDIRLPEVGPSGFTITDYTINFSGTCSKCRRSSTQ